MRIVLVLCMLQQSRLKDCSGHLIRWSLRLLFSSFLAFLFSSCLFFPFFFFLSPLSLVLFFAFLSFFFRFQLHARGIIVKTRVAALMDTLLRSHLLQWLQTGPRRLERLAAFKDVQALLEAAPDIIRAGSKTVAVDAARQLFLLAGCLYNFLKRDAASMLRASSEHSERIITPYAGAHSSSAGATKAEPTNLISVLGLGCFNPGRTGLSQLGTDALLHWRLWAISAAMQEHRLHVLALPGSRLPPGALLPERFPMTWVGARSVDWNCSGFFIDSDLFDSVVVFEELCCERVCWICIQA